MKHNEPSANEKLNFSGKKRIPGKNMNASIIKKAPPTHRTII